MHVSVQPLCIILATILLTFYANVSALPFVQIRDTTAPNTLDLQNPYEQGDHLDSRLFPAGPILQPRAEVNTNNATVCHRLSVDDLKQLPGYERLHKRVQEHYGHGHFNIKTYDEDYPDRAASLCINGPATVQYQDTEGPLKAKYCNQLNNTSTGKLTGTNGTAAVGNTAGNTGTVTTTVVKTTGWGLNLMFQPTSMFPTVIDMFNYFSFAISFTNTEGKTTISSFSTTTTVTVTMTSVEGETCHVENTLSVCNIPGTAKVKITAQGYVWYEFEDKTGDNFNHKAGKHYKWSVPLDYLTEEERSGDVELDMNLAINSRGHFKGVCK
ncbi:hypothetical protein FB446DRAFT_749151 [Lentinula raphanica]|nr:hypothetical protein C8R42DRAFT_689351 [Lentinula raphanica]KAJ3769126.1 hypothetical protein FB446DRAFT_749151 [Lentinula raphanica]